MAWVFLVVALALGAGLLIITFGYTKSIVVLGATLLIGLISIIWYAEFYEGSRTNLIGVDEIRVDNFSVKTTYGNSYEMFARLYNGSPGHTLIAVGLELSASDCTGDDQSGASCVIVGQQDTEIQVEVPAQQARDVTRKFIFPPMRPQGELKWDYTVRYTKARQ